MIDRRGFLVLTAAAGVAAGCAAKTATPPTSPAVDMDFEPAETVIDLGGTSVRTWAYNGRVPGTEIRIRTSTPTPGKWITHCHNTYHLEGGMAGWIFYEN